jgi:hypothetical protein
MVLVVVLVLIIEKPTTRTIAMFSSSTVPPAGMDGFRSFPPSYPPIFAETL